MLWDSFADFTRHYPGRVLTIALGAAAALLLLATGAPSVHGAEGTRPGTLEKARDARMPAGIPVTAGHRLADILDTAADGEAVAWHDLESGVEYRVHPLATFRTGDRQCRAFTIRRVAENGVHESYRTACRSAAGGWVLSVASGTGGG